MVIDINVLGPLTPDDLRLLILLFMSNENNHSLQHEVLTLGADSFVIHLSHTLNRRDSANEEKTYHCYDVDSDDVLGQGGFGVVIDGPRTFKFDPSEGTIIVKDRTLNAGYAIKCLKDNLDLNAAVLIAQKEINLLFQLYLPGKRPKKVSVVDGQVRALLPKLPGINLAVYLKSQAAKLQIGRILSIMKQGAENVRNFHTVLAHSHNDVKESNFLYDHVENRVYICDPGLATPMQGQILGSYIGTDLYRAPEILRGRPISEKTDAYSYGKVMTFFMKRISSAPFYNQFNRVSVFNNEIHRILYNFPMLQRLHSVKKFLDMNTLIGTIAFELNEVIFDMQHDFEIVRITVGQFAKRINEIAERFIRKYMGYLQLAVNELEHVAEQHPEFNLAHNLFTVAQQQWLDEFDSDISIEDLLVSCDMHFERVVEDLLQLSLTPALVTPPISTSTTPEIRSEHDMDEDEIAIILSML